MRSWSQRTARMLTLVLAALAALALAACGDDGSSSDEGGPKTASLTPGGVPVYVDAVVRPEGDQLEGLLAAIGTISGEEDPGGLLPAAIDEGLAGDGLSYSEDISPWLGSEAGLYLTEFSSEDAEGAAIISVTDRDAAQSALDKLAEANDAARTDASYEGVEYSLDDDGGAFGFVGDYLVAGTEAGFKDAVDASSGESLADDAAAAEALASAPEGSLFRAYIDATALFDQLVAGGIITQRDLDTATAAQADALNQGPIVLSGAADADSFSLEASGPAGLGVASGELISGLPAASWLATGVPSVGEAISQGYEAFLSGAELGLEDAAQGFPDGAGLPSPELGDIEAELQRRLGLDLGKDLAWAGDLSLFVQGSTPFNIGGGITIETDDEQAAAAAMNKLRKALRRNDGLRVSETADGFQVVGAGTPVGAEVAVREGKVVIAFLGVTIDDVLSPSETLAASGSFEQASGALGDGLDPQFFLDIPPIVALVENLGQAGDPGFQQAKPVLDSLNYVIGGSGEREDRTVSRVVLGLRDGGGSAAPAASIAP